MQTPASLLSRHLSGDWGELDEHGQREDEVSLENGCRLLSADNLSNGTRIWIIIEAARSSTTLLLPSEY